MVNILLNPEYEHGIGDLKMDRKDKYLLIDKVIFNAYPENTPCGATWSEGVFLVHLPANRGRIPEYIEKFKKLNP